MNKGILLVEDEVVIARELEGYLKDLGYHVCAIASSAEEAIALAEQFQPDLTLMDISLGGGLDGTQVAIKIRESWKIPTIYLTAHSDQATLDRAKAAFPYGYLVKPVDPLELNATIEMAMERIKLENEREELLAQLQEALSKVKVLSGLLPICANCKQIRDDKGYWHSIEVYIRDHSQADFSHGICPKCVRKLYPDIADDL